MKKLYDELKNLYEMGTSKQTQDDFKAEMARKTSYYQNKYGFETSPRKGHEFWNNEADAFKHAFGSARMSLDMGWLGSFFGGIQHESTTPNNPPQEWNMDSWNNNEGRKIIDDIKKEYGKDFYNFSKQKQDDIIAEKVMIKMQKGELITHPSDKREYRGLENFINKPGKSTGGAAPVTPPFTSEQIGKMSQQEFNQNEAKIIEQVKNGTFNSQSQGRNFSGYSNPITNDGKIFTQEDIGNMSQSEFDKNESAINAQMGSIGVPTNREMEASVSAGGAVYVAPYTRDDGTQVRGYYRSR